MPRKKVTEMRRLERLRHSLGAKTFRGVLLTGLIIGTAAILFSFYLYSGTVSREFRTATYRAAKAAAYLIDKDAALEKAEQVMTLYESYGGEMDDGTIGASSEVPQDIRDGKFDEMCGLMRMVQADSEGVACYVAALDVENNRMIFVVDSDPKETFRPPGSWDALEPKYIDAFMNGGKVRKLDELLGREKPMPVIAASIKKYGYRCTAGVRIGDANGYPVFVFMDTDMNRVAAISKDFLLQFLLILLGVSILTGLLISRLQKRSIVDPINKLAVAALEYAEDKKDGKQDALHFDNLNIRTGDEIENLAIMLKELESEVTEYVEDLKTVTAEKERINTELDVASRIQDGMIPHIFPAFPEREEFDLYANIRMAREVGGDFYDFFLVDQDHLAIIMADVSGKGIPAALFMMGSMIMINNYANMGERSPAKILEQVNDNLAKNNSAEMFVTVWLGILEISTGTLTAANAGHEYPAIMRKDGSFELIKEKHGFVLGEMESMKYNEYVIKLEPGDAVFQYTDGVPEAMNTEGEAFGTDRMLEAINEFRDRPQPEMLQHLLDKIDEFVGGEPQFDDITMLCIRYNGAAGSPYKGSDAVRISDDEIDVEAKKENLERVIEFLDRKLNSAGCSAKAKYQTELAVEEIFANIAMYAYPADTGRVSVRVELTDDQNEALITITDSGIPYDPLKKADPDITLSAEERQIGGLGIYLTRKSMDEVTYEYRDGHNILRMRKTLKASE